MLSPPTLSEGPDSGLAGQSGQELAVYCTDGKLGFWEVE